MRETGITFAFGGVGQLFGVRVDGMFNQFGAKSGTTAGNARILGGTVNLVLGILGQGDYNYESVAGGVSADLIPFSKWIAWGAPPVATQQCITAFGTTDFRADLKKITVPTLVAHGDSDRIVPFEVSGKLSHEMIREAGSRC